MKSNTGVWATLLLLSAISFCMSKTMGAGILTTLILMLAGVKSALVGWQFMELRTAHPAWSVALFAVIAGVLALVVVLVLHTGHSAV